MCKCCIYLRRDKEQSDGYRRLSVQPRMSHAQAPDGPSLIEPKHQLRQFGPTKGAPAAGAAETTLLQVFTPKPRVDLAVDFAALATRHQSLRLLSKLGTHWVALLVHLRVQKVRIESVTKFCARLAHHSSCQRRSSCHCPSDQASPWLTSAPRLA